MIKMQKYNLDENVMEVPKNFLEDVEEWLYKVYGSHLAYCYNYQLEEIKKAKISNEKYNKNKKPFAIAKESEFIKLQEYIFNKYANKRRVIRMGMGMDTNEPFKLSNYPTKYGDLSIIKKKLSIRYRSILKTDIGQYNPQTKVIDIYSHSLYSMFLKFFGEDLNLYDRDYAIFTLGEDEKNELFLIQTKTDLDRFLTLLVKETKSVIEHEFIHLIQDFLFSEKIQDLDYSSTNSDKYYTSSLELNPWIVSSFSAFEMAIELKKYRYTKEDLQIFISKSEYFNTLKKFKSKLYNKNVGSFYQLVSERLGELK